MNFMIEEMEEVVAPSAETFIEGALVGIGTVLIIAALSS